MQTLRRKWSYYVRLVHWWTVPLACLPLLLIVLSGILLLVRREFDTLHPATRHGQRPGFSLQLDQVLGELAQKYPGEMVGADAVAEIRIIPKRGVTKIRLKSRREIQLDSHSGAILHDAYRWSALVIALHEGSYFSLATTYLIYLPASLAFLVLWATGVHLLWGSKRWKRRKREGLVEAQHEADSAREC